MDRYTASLKKQYILSLFTFLGSGLCGSISCGYVYFTTGSMLFLLEFLMTMSGALIQLVYCYIAKKLYDNRSHQYEHRLGKFESFGSLVGLFILYLNLMIVVVLSILKLFNPTPISQPTAFSIALIIWCLGYDCIMIANCLRQKKANNTKVLQGQLIQMSKNFINWLICGACAIVAFYWPTSVMAPYVEPVACLVIVLVIGYLSFPLIKENRMWLGYGFKGGATHFITHYKDHATAGDHKEGMVRVSGVVWYTNLDHNKRHSEIILVQRYHGNEDAYPHYDNYDAIEVSKTQDIPLDYEGIMGVPITFLTKYNPEQFEIIGATESEGKGFSCGLWYPESGVAQAMIDGKRVYKRLFIRNRNPLTPEEL